MNFRQATPLDCEALAKFTVEEFPSYDLLSRLGLVFLRDHFFLVCVTSKQSLVLVAEQSGEILGFVAILEDYRAFQQQLRKSCGARVYKWVLLWLWNRSLGFTDLVHLVVGPLRIDRATSSVKSQIGPIFVRSHLQGTSQGGLLMYRLIQNARRLLKEKRYTNYWAIVDHRNARSHGVCRAFGMRNVGEVKLFKKRSLLFVGNL